jgi:RNA polymerase sigma-70 factor (ECF subfamily)
MTTSRAAAMTALRLTDTDAGVLARAGSAEAAFDAIFARHFAAVHAFVARRIGADHAEDVTAETFARAYAARRRYDPAYPSALPWLLGIATNVLRRHWRTERRRLESYARAVAHEIPGAPPDASRDTILALARLPRRQREVVLLHAWADLTYEEISRALDVPVGTVRSRLARARARLAPSLPEHRDA